MEDKITYSVDLGRLTKEDVDQTSELAEKFFNMESKPDEIPASDENKEFILNKIPECDNIIKANDKVIGFTFIVPCNKDIMERFLSRKITENQLFEEVKKNINYNSFNTIYLCSAFVLEEYRGRGLSVQGFVKSIKKIVERKKIKPIIFSWPQTDGGKQISFKIAKILGLELKLKQN